MSTKEGLRQQATELANEVKAKSAAFEKGEISPADFSTFMDNAESKNTEIGSSLKAYDRAARLSGAADMAPAETAPVASTHNVVNDAFDRIKSAAASRGRESVGFELGFKAQGVTGLMGDAASGTSAPSALSGYFLGGAAGPAVAPEIIPGITELRFYPNQIAQLFPNLPVSSPVVTYVREASWTNNAAGVAEGATKPTSTNSLTRYTEQVGKVAALARVTDELIADPQGRGRTARRFRRTWCQWSAQPDHWVHQAADHHRGVEPRHSGFGYSRSWCGHQHGQLGHPGPRRRRHRHFGYCTDWCSDRRRHPRRHHRHPHAHLL